MRIYKTSEVKLYQRPLSPFMLIVDRPVIIYAYTKVYSLNGILYKEDERINAGVLVIYQMNGGFSSRNGVLLV